MVSSVMEDGASGRRGCQFRLAARKDVLAGAQRRREGLRSAFALPWPKRTPRAGVESGPTESYEFHDVD